MQKMRKYKTHDHATSSKDPYIQTGRTFARKLCYLLSGVYLYLLFRTPIYDYFWIRFLLFFGAAYTVLDLVSIWCHRPNRKYNKKAFLRNRSLKSLRQIRKTLGLVSAASLCLLIVIESLANLNIGHDTSYGDMQTFNRGGYPVNQYYDDQYQLKENLDTIKLIRDEQTFQSLTYSEKCDVVRAVILCEARYLGLCEIQIVFDELPENTLGQYRHATHTIIINPAPLKDGSISGGTAEDVLKTCLHECRHCYQYLMAELYASVSPEQRNLCAFKDLEVDLWIKNINNYSSVDNDSSTLEILRYSRQPLEVDARRFSERDLKVFYAEIDELLNE